MAQSLYKSACDPFFGGLSCCLTCPLSCNGAGCKNCLNGFNNSVFDGICGPDCIGIPKPLCGCCGNCALCWYAGCCEYCYIADLSIATGGDANKWKDVAYPLVFWYVIASIFSAISNVLPAGSTGRNLCGTIQQIIEALLHISSCVMFGKAATGYAQQKGWGYEGEECCKNCGFSLGCDECGFAFQPTLMCCLTYWCCFQCHFVQVGRAMETEGAKNITAGRPQECAACCDCWDTMGGSAPQGTQQGTTVE